MGQYLLYVLYCISECNIWWIFCHLIAWVFFASFEWSESQFFIVPENSFFCVYDNEVADCAASKAPSNSLNFHVIVFLSWLRFSHLISCWLYLRFSIGQKTLSWCFFLTKKNFKEWLGQFWFAYLTLVPVASMWNITDHQFSSFHNNCRVCT